MPYHLRTEKTWQQTVDDLDETMRKWGVTTWSITPQHTTRTASKVNVSRMERTVTLRWTRRGNEVVLTMDRQDRALDNLRVLYLAAEALRLNESRGIGETVAEAYRQAYPQLPAPGETSAPSSRANDPYAVLYVRPDAPLAVCEAAYRALAQAAHPDRGGSQAEMALLNVAIAAVRKERSGA